MYQTISGENNSDVEIPKWAKSENQTKNDYESTFFD